MEILKIMELGGNYQMHSKYFGVRINDSGPANLNEQTRLKFRKLAQNAAKRHIEWYDFALGRLLESLRDDAITKLQYDTFIQRQTEILHYFKLIFEQMQTGKVYFDADSFITNNKLELKTTYEELKKYATLANKPYVTNHNNPVAIYEPMALNKKVLVKEYNEEYLLKTQHWAIKEGIIPDNEELEKIAIKQASKFEGLIAKYQNWFLQERKARELQFKDYKLSVNDMYNFNKTHIENLISLHIIKGAIENRRGWLYFDSFENYFWQNCKNGSVYNQLRYMAYVTDLAPLSLVIEDLSCYGLEDNYTREVIEFDGSNRYYKKYSTGCGGKGYTVCDNLLENMACAYRANEASSDTSENKAKVDMDNDNQPIFVVYNTTNKIKTYVAYNVFGFGIINFKENSKEIIEQKLFTYKGTIKRTNGNQGYQIFISGDKYEGQFKDKKKHGKGTYYYPDGDIYEGEWKNDKKDGYGVFKDKDGKIWYKGTYKDGNRHGKGIFTYADGYVYEGEWKNNERDGVGIIKDENGVIRYQGTFKNDKRHGKGVAAYKDGGKYEGGFYNDMAYGYGTLTFANGKKYQGQFKDGKFNGHGVYTFADGATYDGEWQNDKRHGKGVDTYPDGYRSEGTYKNDQAHGLFKATFKDTTYLQSFENGKLHGKYEYYNDTYDNDVSEYANDVKINNQIANFKNGSQTYRIYDKDGNFKFWFAMYTTPVVQEHDTTQKGNVRRVGFVEKDEDTTNLKAPVMRKYYYQNGEVYFGQIYNKGLANGYGTMYYPDGSFKTGIWKDNVLEVLAYNSKNPLDCYNNKNYKGDLLDGKRHGNGTYTYADGSVYTGSWQNDMRNGKGIINFANGDRFEGEFASDLQNGQGTMAFANGATFAGSWQNGKWHGEGEFKYDNTHIKGTWNNQELEGTAYCNVLGNIYNGEFKNSLKHGHGKMEYLDGSVYDGEWQENKHCGFGVMRYDGGDYYVGYWQNNLKNGKGVYLFANGAVLKGKWEKDKFSYFSNFEDEKIDSVLNSETIKNQIKSFAEGAKYYDKAVDEFYKTDRDDVQVYKNYYISAMYGYADAIQKLKTKNPVAQFFYTRYLQDTGTDGKTVFKMYKKLYKKCNLALYSYIRMLEEGIGTKPKIKKADKLRKKINLTGGSTCYRNIRSNYFGCYPELIMEQIIECVEHPSVYISRPNIVKVEDIAQVEVKG